MNTSQNIPLQELGKLYETYNGKNEPGQKAIATTIHTIQEIIENILKNSAYDQKQFLSFIREIGKYIEYSLLYPEHIPIKEHVFSMDDTTKEQLYTFIEEKCHTIFDEKNIQNIHLLFIVYFFLVIDKKSFENLLDTFYDFPVDQFVNIFTKYTKQLLDEKNANKIPLIQKNFLALCELFNKMCIFYEMDTTKKEKVLEAGAFFLQTIQKIENAYTFGKNNNVKQNLHASYNEEEFLKKIQYFHGRILINFSHIAVTGSHHLDIPAYIDALQKQKTGREISRSANFGNNQEKEIPTLKVCIGNMTHLLAELFEKLSQYEHQIQHEMIESVFTCISDTYLPLVNRYNAKIIEHIPNSHSFQEWMHFFCNVFFYFLDTDPNPNNLITHIHNIKQFSYFEIETLYHLIQYLSLGQDTYAVIVEMITQENNYSHHYNFEYIKIKILETIVQKITKQKEKNNHIENIFSRINSYMKKYHICKQFPFLSGQLYLHMGYFYSFFDETTYEEKAINYLQTYFQIFGSTRNSLVSSYLHNLTMRKISKFCKEKNIECNTSCVFCTHQDEPEECLFQKKQLDFLGSMYVKDFLENNWYKKLEKVEKMIIEKGEEYLTGPNNNSEQFLHTISQSISEEIFLGMIQVNILHKTHSFEKQDFLHPSFLYNSFTRSLVDGYYLIFTYLKSHETFIQSLLEEKGVGVYIFKKLQLILNSYIEKKNEYFDMETKLPNRKKLEYILSQEHTPPINLIHINFDILKMVENVHGKEKASKIFLEFITKIQNFPFFHGNVFYIQNYDIAIVIKETKQLDAILSYIQEIIKKIDEKDPSIPFFSHIGVSIASKENALEKATIATILAKEHKQPVYFFTTSKEEKNILSTYFTYIPKLKEAIKHNRITPFFQPIIASSGEIYKYEVLLRIKESNGTYASPKEYLEADQVLNRGDILQTIIKKTFEYASKYDGKFSINISGNDLIRPDIQSMISQYMILYNIEPHRITFEILEENWEEYSNLSQLYAYKSLGFSFAIDDFGSKYSNLDRYIELLTSNVLDYLKIDQKLILALSQYNEEIQQSLLHLLAGIVASAHTFNIKVVAEGIEDKATLELCKSIGVDYFQGYFFSKPVAPEHIHHLPKRFTL